MSNTRYLIVGGGMTADAAVEGILRLKDLQAAALPSGQIYGPDPTEWAASVGGSIATNASAIACAYVNPPRNRSSLARKNSMMNRSNPASTQ